jgi:hypothetical protein
MKHGNKEENEKANERTKVWSKFMHKKGLKPRVLQPKSISTINELPTIKWHIRSDFVQFAELLICS